MKCTIHLLAVAIVGLALGGCAQDYMADPFLDLTAEHKLLSKDGSTSFGRPAGLVLNPYTYAPRPGEHSYYLIASDPKTDAAARKEARNALIEAMIIASDYNVSIHLADVKSTQSSTNLVFGAVSLGLSGAASVVSGGTSNALAAASTGTQGARALATEQVWRETFAESIVLLVTTKRKELAQAIRGNYKDDLVAYPMERGIADVMAYHETGSVYFGLAMAREAIDEKRKEIATETKKAANVGQDDGSKPDVAKTSGGK